MTSGFSRPPARPPPLWLPQLAGWTPPAPCTRVTPTAVESPIAFSWFPTPKKAAQCFQASEKQVGHVWAVRRTYPVQLNCTDSRPRARLYQLRELPLVDSECVFLQCNSSFVFTRGSAIGLRRSRPYFKRSLEAQTEKVELPSQHNLQPSNAQWYDHSGTLGMNISTGEHAQAIWA